MGHHIEVIITSQKPDQEKLQTLDLPTITEGHFSIIPLDVVIRSTGVANGVFIMNMETTLGVLI